MFVTHNKVVFVGGSRVQPGAEFELPDDAKLEPGMKKVEKAKAEKPKKAEKTEKTEKDEGTGTTTEPDTLAGLAKANQAPAA